MNSPLSSILRIDCRTVGRQNPAMLSSTLRPSSTILIFSSAEHCLRVARRMSLTKFSPLTCLAQDFCLISTPLLGSYDVPETRPYQINPICPIGADVKKTTACPVRTIHCPAVVCLQTLGGWPRLRSRPCGADGPCVGPARRSVRTRRGYCWCVCARQPSQPSIGFDGVERSHTSRCGLAPPVRVG